MTKRRLFLAGLVTLLLTVGLFYNYYKKPRREVASAAVAYSSTAENLYTDFVKDEAGANQKYVGKVIEVSGVVKEVTIDSVAAILLSAENEEGGINCSIKDDDISTSAKGKRIVVKGICTGFLLDVNLVDVVLVNG